MKIAFDPVAFPKLGPLDAINLAGKVGYDGVVAPSGFAAQVAGNQAWCEASGHPGQLADAAAAAGVRLVAVHAGFSIDPVDAASLRSTLQRVRDQLDEVARLGARILILRIGGGPAERVASRAHAALRALADEAAQRRL